MIKNNTFFFNSLKNIVILGYLEKYDQIKAINKDLNINTHLITSPSFKNRKNDEDHKVFSKLDKNFNKFIRKNFNINETLFVSFGPRWIFKKDLISKLMNNNLVNFHSSRLPLDAGGGGFSWRVMRNDRLGNCLVHLVDSGVDSGPILKNQEFIFSKNCKTPKDFENENNVIFFEFYKKFIFELKSKKKINFTSQSQNLRKYNPRLDTKLNGWIDWFNSSYEIYNFINAFDEPYIGASTQIGKTKVRLKDVHLHGGEIKSHPFSSGIVIRKNRNWIVVATSDSDCLIVEKVINSKNKNIINSIKEGDRFFTPVKQLVKSRSNRVFYNSISKKSYFKK